MIWFLLVAAAVLAAVFVWRVVAFSRSDVHPFIWRAAVASALIVGLYPSFWLGFRFRYAYSKTVEILGFPIPVKFFVLGDRGWEERNRWINELGDVPLGSMNVLLNVTLFFLPLAIGMFYILGPRRSTGQQAD